MHKVTLTANWDWVLYQFRMPLARALRAAGYDVTLICPRGPLVARMQDEGFPWHEWHLDRASLNPFIEVGAIRALARLYRVLKPRVAHHSTIKPNLYGSFAARGAAVPAVINAFSGLGYVFSPAPQAGLIRLGAIPLMRRAFSPARVFTVFDNANDQRVLIERRIVDADRAILIPGSGTSGVNTQLFHPAAGNGRRELVVVMGARLLYDKGVAEFIEAARELSRNQLPLRFQLAGAADLKNPAAVPEAQLDQWRREGIVEFLGQRGDMDAVLRAADIAVLPSYHEGSPRFLMEAGATGLPLVATDIEGCRTLVRDGVNGVLVPVKNAAAVAAAVARLAADAALRARMGEESRKLVVRDFDEAAIVHNYLAVFERAASQFH